MLTILLGRRRVGGEQPGAAHATPLAQQLPALGQGARVGEGPRRRLHLAGQQRLSL